VSHQTKTMTSLKSVIKYWNLKHTALRTNHRRRIWCRPLWPQISTHTQHHNRLQTLLSETLCRVHTRKACRLHASLQYERMQPSFYCEPGISCRRNLHQWFELQPTSSCCH